VFVTLEGPEGAGKSTVAIGLVSALREKGLEVVLTREPGSGQIGQKIRSLLLDTEGMTPRCELFLFLADRSQHVETIIRPALELGKIVICDRFADSTVVYQGHARGFDVAQLRAWNDFATGGLKPDLTLLLDLPASQGIARLENKDRLDNEPIEFHEKVRQGFLIEASIAPDRWTQVDASQNPGTVLEDCIEAMSAILEKRIIKGVGII